MYISQKSVTYAVWGTTNEYLKDSIYSNNKSPCAIRSRYVRAMEYLHVAVGKTF